MAAKRGQRPAAQLSEEEQLMQAIAANYPDTPLAERVISEYSRIIGAPIAADAVPERALFEAGLLFREQPEEREANAPISIFS